MLVPFFRQPVLLPDDAMILIVENVDYTDLPNLSLVDKSWCKAVRQANLALELRGMVHDKDLEQICTKFENLVGLRLSLCHQLSPEGLQVSAVI